MVQFKNALSIEKIMQEYAANFEQLAKISEGWVLIQNLGTPTFAFVHGQQRLLVSVYLNSADGLYPVLKIPSQNLLRPIIWGIGIHESEHSGHPARVIFKQIMTSVIFLLGALDEQTTIEEETFSD